MAALAAYRHLLRSTRIAFHGDLSRLNAARIQARESFDKNRSLDFSSKEAADGIAHTEAVAKLLRHNIVQGVQEEGQELLRLRIHKDTERGDNDTVKLGGKAVKIGQSCT